MCMVVGDCQIGSKIGESQEVFYRQTPFLHFLVEKIPPQVVPLRFFFPWTQVNTPSRSWQRSLVRQGPGFTREQGDPTEMKVHTLEQQSVLGTAVPASHCSPASMIPFPHTARGAPDEKSMDGGGTTAETDTPATTGVLEAVAD